MIDETLFPHSNNEVVILVIDPTDLSDSVNHPNGKPYDFIDKGVTLMELYLGGSKFSSDTGGIIYNSDGEIIIKLGDELTDVSQDISFNSFIKVYDVDHPDGQYMNNNRTDNSTLKLTVVDPSTY